MTENGKRFMAAMRDWLLENDDPRLVVGPNGEDRIEQVCGAASDYCGALARRNRSDLSFEDERALLAGAGELIDTIQERIKV